MIKLFKLNIWHGKCLCIYRKCYKIMHQKTWNNRACQQRYIDRMSMNLVIFQKLTNMMPLCMQNFIDTLSFNEANVSLCHSYYFILKTFCPSGNMGLKLKSVNTRKLIVAEVCLPNLFFYVYAVYRWSVEDDNSIFQGIPPEDCIMLGMPRLREIRERALLAAGTYRNARDQPQAINDLPRYCYWEIMWANAYVQQPTYHSYKPCQPAIYQVWFYIMFWIYWTSKQNMFYQISPGSFETRSNIHEFNIQVYINHRKYISAVK